ncbi:hypothetical protein [Roseitranquillus sediminis]|uniref:hypothetical protein n=1 Tax=Roseitranquillus sediminis TaxID=2809051 RepID=UPI001D0C6B68|nr:hypothetical protein [Roseitranquillus sediminis]MBM9593990.1 hypothetical protein [Roseitranquillus sediminis]
MQETRHIGRKASSNILHAIDFAKFIDHPLNLYVVIRLGETEDPALVFQKIHHKCRVWLQRRLQQLGREVLPPLYAFSLENPTQCRPHVNWMVHIPAELHREFQQKLTQWVRKASGSEPGLRDIHISPVDPYTDKRLGNYIVKGTDPRYVDHLHLTKVACLQGLVRGRRASPSRALSRAARAAAGFVPRRDRDKWKARLGDIAEKPRRLMPPPADEATWF